MASHIKKDYYQFCYDENEVVSSNDSSYDEDCIENSDIDGDCNSDEESIGGDSSSDLVDEILMVSTSPLQREEEEGYSDIQTNKTVRSHSYHNSLDDIIVESEKKDHLPERRTKSCCFDIDPFDAMDEIACSTDSVLSSPTSESIELDGYVIEIDEVSNTINISSSPLPTTDYLLPNSTEFLPGDSPSSDGYIHDDDLSSSGVSLDSRLSSANSLTTEIDRLRNINSPLYIKDTPYHQRYRISANASSEDRLSKKSTKSLNSLISRSSTPDRKSPLLDFLKGKSRISEGKAKSDFDLTKKKTSPKSKNGKDTPSSLSLFRLKRSSSPFKQKKREGSKHKNSLEKVSSNKGVEPSEHNSDPELTLQQPSPFVRTIFQFIESDNDEMFPFGNMNNFEDYIVPVFSSNHGKLFQDISKTNSLSRRSSKNKVNLAAIKRTVYQDGHDPIFLSSCRRVCENSDFLISTIAFLDRVRKVQEFPVKQTHSRRHTIDSSNDSAMKTLQTDYVDISQSDDISNKLGSYNTVRRRLNLPLTIHERFSTFSDSGVFDEDLILSSSDCISKTSLPHSRSRSFSNLSTNNENNKKSQSLSRRSKSLKNIAYSSFRRKDKKKQKSREKLRRNSDINTSVKESARDECLKLDNENLPNALQLNMHSESQSCSDIGNSSDDVYSVQFKACQVPGSIKKAVSTHPDLCEESLTSEQPNNNIAFNHHWKSENKNTTPQNINNSESVNKNCSTTRQPTPAHSDSTTEKQYKPIRFITDKLRNKNKSKNNKITTTSELVVENHTENNSTSTSTMMMTDKRSLPSSPDDQLDSAKGVSNLRKQFEEVTNKNIDNNNKMADTGSGKEPKSEPKRKSGIRRSLSWRVKKDRPKDDHSTEPISPNSPTSPTSPKSPKSPKEKGNKLSSLRSKFEPASPTEKKKWGILPLSPSVKRSHKTSKEFKHPVTDAGEVSKEFKHPATDTGGVTFSSSTQTDSANEDSDRSKSPSSETLSFSSTAVSSIKFRRAKSSSPCERKMSNEMLKDIISGSVVISSPPSSPSNRPPPTNLKGSVENTIIASSSDLYSSVSSFFDDHGKTLTATPDSTSRKMDRKSSNDSTNCYSTLQRKIPKANVSSKDEGQIIVDVPLHLLPPDLAGPRSSPKSSPKNGLRRSFSSKSPRTLPSPVSSPIVKPKKRSFELNLNKGSKDSEDLCSSRSESSTDEHSIPEQPNEINNNFLTQNVSQNDEQNTDQISNSQSPPPVKPKPTNKLRSVAVGKPKTLPSNIAMVSPIMKSEMTSQRVGQSSPSNESSRMAELARNPFKTVKRRPVSALQKWKNLEKEDSKPSATGQRITRGYNTVGRVRRHSDGSGQSYLDKVENDKHQKIKIEKQNNLPKIHIKSTDPADNLDENNKDIKELGDKDNKKDKDSALKVQQNKASTERWMIPQDDSKKVGPHPVKTQQPLTTTTTRNVNASVDHNNVNKDTPSMLDSISQITGAIQQLTTNNNIEVPMRKKKLTYVDSAVIIKRKSLTSAINEEAKKTPPPTSPKPPPPTSPRPPRPSKSTSKQTASSVRKENGIQNEHSTTENRNYEASSLKKTPSSSSSSSYTDDEVSFQSTFTPNLKDTKTSTNIPDDNVNDLPTNRRTIADHCNLKSKPVTAASNNNNSTETAGFCDGQSQVDGSIKDDVTLQNLLSKETDHRTFPGRRTRLRPRTPVSNIFPVNFQQSNAPSYHTCNKLSEGNMPQTTADGKPIGYATKIMCSSATTQVKSNRNSYNLDQNTTNTITTDIPTEYNNHSILSPLVTSNNNRPVRSNRNSNNNNKGTLDTYIEQSFKVIEESLKESAHEMTTLANPNIYHGNHPSTNGQYIEQLTPSETSKPITTGTKSSNDTINLFADNPSSPHLQRTKLRDRLRLKKEAETTEQQNDESKGKSTSPKFIEKNNKDGNDNKLIPNGKSEEPNDLVESEEVKPIALVKLRRTEDLLEGIPKTDDTMKEFEVFLRKQERRAKKEMYRLSQEEPKMRTAASASSVETKQLSRKKGFINRSVSDEDFTLENYRKQQQLRRKQRLEFQQHHLSERRRSLGILPNKWASASNIFLCSTMEKPLERKLSLPHDIHKQAADSADDYNVSTANSPKSNSPDTPSCSGRRSNKSLRLLKDMEGHTGSFDFDKTNFVSNKLKRRSHSTGDNPNSDPLLGHLICDIEEEMVSSEDSDSSDDDGIIFNTQPPEKQMSDENLQTSSPRRERRRRGLRRTRSENLHGDASPRRSRTRERLLRNKSITGESTKNHQSKTLENLKTLEISLLLDQDAERKTAVKINRLEVNGTKSYPDVEELVVESFIEHLKLLDKQMLDIKKDDITYLQFEKTKVSLGSSNDLSKVHMEDGFLPCQLCLKGKKDCSLAAMAYDTLIPKAFLEKYVSLILTHRQVIFYGPSGTGKSYIARRVASMVTQRMNENRIPTIVFKNITESQWKTLLRSISEDRKEEPYVVLLDGFAPSFIKSEKDLTEIINSSETVHPQPYVICTVTQSPNYEIPTPWQNSFKWIWLPNHEEPIDGLLQRYLRRRYIQTGDKDEEKKMEAFRVADWLSSTWRHVNDILEKYHSTECTIGPTMFYTCPTDVDCVEEWFVDLWNYSITPYFIQTVKSGLKLFGQRYEWVDPLETILKTYPWLTENSQRISKLRRIRPEDVGYQPNNPPSCPSSPTQYSETEKERLLDFLRQLELLMHDGGLGELPTFDDASNPVESSI